MNRRIAARLVLALNLSMSSLFAQSTNRAAVKLPPQNNARHNLFLQRIAQNKGAGDVIFIGDSITEQWDEFFTANHALWKQYFGAFNPVNLGVGGDQTGHVLWRISDVAGEGRELVNLNPKVAVLVIGTNNSNNPPGHTDEEIAGGIRAIVEELKRQKPGMKILVLGIFPRGGGVWFDANGLIPGDLLNPRFARINAIVSTLHDGWTVFYKDISKEFLDTHGALSITVMPDGVHLTALGFDIWGKSITNDLAMLVANHAPVANAQNAITAANTARDITLTGRDPECSNLTYRIASGPAHGTLSGTASNVTYTPAAGYSGGDSFTFVVNDGSLDSAPATVAITVGNNTVVATGGTVADYTLNGTHYRAHIFTNAKGTDSLNVVSGGSVELLVVAGGGGGGGGYEGGGGGAGGLRQISTHLPAATYTITVGSGGKGCRNGDAAAAANGQPSSLSNATVAVLVRATGGGRGSSGNPNTAPGIGGSGGGGGHGGGLSGANGTPGEGSKGGDGANPDVSPWPCGGGGGAGSAGGNGSGSTPGPGGAGTNLSFSGSSVTYAAGGRGGWRTTTYTGVDGAANTGNGGEGGGSSNGSGTGGNGGSGIVIVRYAAF